MEFVQTKDDIIFNLQKLEFYLCEGSQNEVQFAAELIRKGKSLIVYKVNEEIRFSPSRYCGYQSNSMEIHEQHVEKDGRETNPAISKALKTRLRTSDELDSLYLIYCHNLGIKPNNQKRSFWNIDSISSIEIFDKKQESVFPEGHLVERKHLSRERNKGLIDEAKNLFKKKNGKLICQICEFDFEDKYGEHGKDFIEVHHTLAVSEMPPNYQTKVEEVAMVCSNCHRMLHRRRPWLSMDELQSLIRNQKS